MSSYFTSIFSPYQIPQNRGWSCFEFDVQRFSDLLNRTREVLKNLNHVCESIQSLSKMKKHTEFVLKTEFTRISKQMQIVSEQIKILQQILDPSSSADPIFRGFRKEEIFGELKSNLDTIAKDTQTLGRRVEGFQLLRLTVVLCRQRTRS